MKAVVREYESRIAKGEASTIRIRGRIIDYRDVVRYWKRRGMSIDAVLALRSRSKTPEAVECLTPMPSPIRTPEVLAIPERIFRMIRDYHQGSFELGTWRSAGPSRDCQSTKGDVNNTLADFNTQCTLSCSLFDRGAFEEARRLLSRAFASIKTIVLAEHPRTLYELVNIVTYTIREDRPEIGIALLHYVSSMGGIKLGDQHPLKLVCGWLASLDLVAQEHVRDILHRSVGAIYETFKRVLGPLHRTTILSLYEHFEMMRMSNQCIDYQESALLELLHECDAALGQDDKRTLDVRLTLARYYFTGGEYTKAREQAQAVLVRSASKLYQIDGLRILAFALYELREELKAIDTQRQTIDLAIHEWGADDPDIQQMMLRLEVWMLEQGMPEAAAQVNEERLRSVDYGTDSDLDDMDAGDMDADDSDAGDMDAGDMEVGEMDVDGSDADVWDVNMDVDHLDADALNAGAMSTSYIFDAE